MKIKDAKRQEILLLTAVMLAEARGEGKEGMQMVGEVIINRVLDLRYPKTITDVICAANQFDCVNINNPNYHIIVDVQANDEFLEALPIAINLIKGNYTLLLPLNVIAYHTGPKPKSKFWDSLVLKGTSKNHKFYC